MSIVHLAWEIEANRDIHVLAGQATRTLNNNLVIFDSANPNGVRAPVYLAAHPTVTLSFNALFKGAPAAMGIQLDAATGRVSVGAALPPLHKNNFIIEVTVTDPADNSTAAETIRVHIHKSVKSLALTPTEITIRPSTATRMFPELTSYRFTARATFDDDTMGDLTTGHGINWTSVGQNVNFDGRLLVDTADPVGKTIDITATLPVALGGKTAVAKIHVGQPWSAEPAMPKASIVPGGGWPGTTLPDQAPNILIMGDGFASTDAAAFEKIAAAMVQFIKTDKVARPFDVLCTSMNFWRVLEPSTQRGISFRCEVYPLDAQHVYPVQRPIKPPAIGQWNLENLIYAVGLPVPLDMAKPAADLRAEWTVLIAVAPPAGAVSNDLIEKWKILGKRGFIDEIDGFPAMSCGKPPSANLKSRTPLLDLHDDRIGRSDMRSFFTALASDNGVKVGTDNIGVVWAARGAFAFDNTDLIVMLSAHPGGRAQNATGFMALPTKGGVVKIAATPVTGGSNFTLNFTAPPADATGDTGRTMTHELGHSFGLQDEYVDFEADSPFTTADLAAFANVQRLDDVLDAAKQIDGKLIRWNWLRVRKAAVVAATAVDDPVVGFFDIPVVPGHGLQFKADDIVLLRLRQPGIVIDFPAKVVESHPLRVVSTSANEVVVTAAAAAVTLADLQAFPAGSTLFMPVPMPTGFPAPPEPFARMVAKNVEDLITRTHAPLYTRPAGGDLTYKIKNNEEIQQPKLDGLTPSLPGRPFCFKDKPSIVGLYGGGARYATKIFHPAGANCMMRNSDEAEAPFCAVCRYIMVEMINPSCHFTINLDYDDIYPLR
jgi:IgA Peptidase M64